MATNVEKFVVDLGFNDADLKKLKELLKLQQTADKNAPKRLQQTARQTNEERKQNTLTAKRLQMKKLIARAEKEGVDTSKYKRSLASAQKITTLEKRRLELEELTFKAKEVNQKKIQAAKQKELNTEKKITQEKVKQTSPSLADRQALLIAQQEFGRSKARRIRNAGGDTADQKFYSDRAEEVFKLKAKSALQYDAALKKLNNDIQDYVDKQRQATMRTRKANIAMQGLNDSTRHMIRSYASLYAVFEATSAINRTGQQFEAMNSAMLAATGTSEMAANEVAFLDKMTSRLGLSLLDTSDAYTKFLFASKGKLDQDQTRELFTGLSELGTTLGVSKERMKLSMNAITQISSRSAATVM